MTIQGKNIRVLVVDDSAVYRTLINTNLSRKPGIEIIGISNDAYDAQEKMKTLKPDVISLDVEMPKMSGIELTKKLMATYAVPIILVSSANINVFEALQAGAVDFVKKPDANRSISPEDFIEELVSKIKIASVAKISKNSSEHSDLKAEKKENSVSATRSSISSVNSILNGSSKDFSDKICNSTLIAIGASTGGTEATLEVLKRLPKNVPPILIVQHMPAGFTRLYAERLNRICSMSVKEAQDGEILTPGQAYIAPGDYQMTLTKIGTIYKLRCKVSEKVSGHCPSVDALFSSIAKESTKNNVGIIMTGMGKDGAEGLLEMKKKGAYTIGESQESCVVYGMPMVAHNIGAVKIQANNKEIASLIVKHLNTLG